MARVHQIIAFFLFNSCLAIFLTYGVFFNKIASDFGQSPSSTSLAFSTFAVLYGLSSLLAGLLIHRYGPSRTMLIGGTLMGLGLFLSSRATSLEALIITYGVVGGAGTGSMWPTTSYVVFEKFDRREIRSITGLVSAGTAFGSLFFAPLEAFLISYFDWRLAFIILGILVVTLAGLAAISARGSHAPRYGNLRPILARAMKKKFASLYAYYAIGNAFSRSLVIVFIVPMLEAQGMSLLAASVTLSFIGAGSIVGRLTTGLKSLSEEQVSGLSFILQGVSAILVLFSRDFISLALLALAFGVGYGGYIPEFALLTRKYFGAKAYAAIFGLLLTSYSIGAFVGPLFEGYSLEVFGNFAVGFYVAGLASIIVGVHQILGQKANLQSEPAIDSGSL